MWYFENQKVVSGPLPSRNRSTGADSMSVHLAIADGLDEGAEANRFAAESDAKRALVQDVLFDRLREDHRRPPRLIAATPRRASMLPRIWIGVAARSLFAANSTQARERESSYFAQRGQIDLGVHLRSGQRDMPEMVGDLLERNAFGQQMRRAGVPESVWAIAWQNKSEPMQTLAYHRAESRSSEGSIRLDARQKDLSQLALRSHLAEVSKDRCPDFANERVVLTLALLGTPNADDLALPVDVLKAKVAHLAAAHAVHGNDQQHRVISDLARRVACTSCK